MRIYNQEHNASHIPSPRPIFERHIMFFPHIHKNACKLFSETVVNRLLFKVEVVVVVCTHNAV